MSIVETMARAICLDVDVLAQGGPDSRYGSITERVEASWRDYTATARAALRAIKPSDISDGMVEAYLRAHGGSDESVKKALFMGVNDFRRALAAAIAAGAEQSVTEGE